MSFDDPLGRDAAARLARRPWPARLLRPGFDLSFEFFPPKSDAGITKLADTLESLAPLDPRFVSVTYGAGGTTRDRTQATVGRIVDTTGVPVAAHLTCVASTTEEIHSIIDQYRAMGVSHVVALRGDPPARSADESGRDPGSVGDFADARSLVEAIRGRSDGDSFEISVAAYPEVHPLARSPEADLDNLKAKVDAGADRAITQFFFDPDDFLRFWERARAVGIDVPIVPGIMPITSFDKVAGFARRCGARVPEWMTELFGDLADAPDVHRLVAATVAAEQCRYLAERGVQAFHFYTMNRGDLTSAICRILGVRADPVDASRRALVS